MAAGIAKSQVDAKDFDDVKRLLVERGEMFAQTSIEARTQIAQLGMHMLPLDGAVVLTHGYSRVLVALFLAAAKTRHLSVMVAESHPDGDGHTTAKQLSAAGVPKDGLGGGSIKKVRRGTILHAVDAVRMQWSEAQEQLNQTAAAANKAQASEPPEERPPAAGDDDATANEPSESSA